MLNTFVMYYVYVYYLSLIFHIGADFVLLPWVLIWMSQSAAGFGLAVIREA